MELEKICRTCMGFSGPLLSIYDGGTAAGTANCIAAMLSDVTKIMPRKGDNLPEKVCLTCISEINRCYSYKMKVENSNRTLRQLIPDALPEETPFDRSKLVFADKSIQTLEETLEKKYLSIETQTDFVEPVYLHECDESKEQEETETIPEVLAEPLKVIKTESNGKKHMKQMSSPHYDDDHQSERNPLQECDEKVKDSSHLSEQEIDDIDERNENTNESTYNDGNVFEIYEEYVLEDDHINKDQHNYSGENGVDEAQEDFIKICNEDEASEKSQLSDDEDDEDENQIEYNISICNETDESKALKEDTVFKATKFQCPNCVMSFVSVKNLNKHISKRHCVRIAQAVLNTDSNTDETPEIEILKDSKKAKVNFTPAKDDMYEPPPRILKTEPQPMEYSCEQCKATFALKKSLLYHYRSNACTVKSFPCNECSKVFNTEQNLEEHKSTHILSNNCNECSKVFPTKEELSQHMLDAHNRKAKNQCHICKKVFTMLSTLKDHMRIHTGEKPFACTICPKRFTQNANLKQHLLRHSQNKPFKCDECPKSYCTRSEFYSHKRTHTGDQPFRCDFCDARFTTNSSMVKHRRKHTGERPYACDLCPMRFSSSNVLKNHRRTHTGEKPFKCSYCPKAFAQKGDCQNHQRTHLQSSTNKISIGPQSRRLKPKASKIEKEFVSEDEDYEDVSGDDVEILGSESEVVLMEIDLE